MMLLRKTAKICLNLKPAEVMPTMLQYTAAFNMTAEVGFKKKIKNSRKLHDETYYSVRSAFPDLPADLVCSSRLKAAEAVKGVLTKTKHKKYGSQPKSKLQSIRYANKYYRIFPDMKSGNILLIGGRKKFTFEIAPYYQALFQPDWQHKSAELVIRKNKVYLHIVFEKEVAEPASTGKIIGIDRGINNIAATSNNKFYGSGTIRKQVRKYQRHRSSLQKKGTKSAKRHLRKLSGKERQFRADTNHKISKQIISQLKPGDTLVLEDLKGIRNKGNKFHKKQRTLINSWSYFQLEEFIIYKAIQEGIFVVFVKAAYTSQKCSDCDYTDKKNRKQKWFCCKDCGFQLDADLNGSRNIADKHRIFYMKVGRAVVNQPIVSSSAVVAGTNQQTCAVGN